MLGVAKRLHVSEVLIRAMKIANSNPQIELHLYKLLMRTYVERRNGIYILPGSCTRLVWTSNTLRHAICEDQDEDRVDCED